MSALKAEAETLQGALQAAYTNNPTLSGQRAATRAADENVLRARSGFLPQIGLSGQNGYQSSGYEYPSFRSVTRSTSRLRPSSIGLTVQQNLWNGNKTSNSVLQAEAGVNSSRERLRLAEESVFQSGIKAYMDVVRDRAILALQSSNQDVLEEQLKQTRGQFSLDNATRTDVAQAEAALARGIADRLTAESNLKSSEAAYREVFGKLPGELQSPPPAGKGLPAKLDEAVTIALREHPAVRGAREDVRAAQLNVDIARAAFFPVLSLSGQIQKSYNSYNNIDNSRNWVAGISASLTMPLYDGGLTDATQRQAREQLSQQQADLDAQQNKVRAQLISAWGLFRNSAAIIRAAQSEEGAAAIAVSGVRDEAQFGRRTILDILNAQHALVSARVNLVRAQHDQVVASYDLLAALGRLSFQYLKLQGKAYDPEAHLLDRIQFDFGLRLVALSDEDAAENTPAAAQSSDLRQ